jgi:hypothetical protein
MNKLISKKRNVVVIAVCLAAMAAVFTGCKKDGGNGNTSGKTVYVAGYEGSGSKTVATLWKNGKTTPLTDGSQNADAQDVFVTAAGDVYVAGSEYKASGGALARVWKNGKVQPDLAIGAGSVLTAANAIYVSGAGAYVAGIEITAANINIAKLWKPNGTAQDLSTGVKDASAYGVSVSPAGNVYVVGSEKSTSIYGNSLARVWKDGSAQTLPVSNVNNDAVANCVFVTASGDVYVGGYERISNNGYLLKIWKNNTLWQTLTDGVHTCSAMSIFVSDNGDVYVSGYESNGSFNVAKLWKISTTTGTTVTALSDGSSRHAYANSVYVSENDVYVAISENGAGGKLWTNGETKTLTTTGGAYAVVVK